jgi:chloramphenicol 3-O phosphotransferase
MIIFLNGTSSSGKSTIAKALQIIYPTPFLTLGIDTFLNMMPPQYIGSGEKAADGFQFISDQDEEGPITRVEAGKYGKKIVGSMPKIVNHLVNDGHDLIVDEVLFGDETLKSYVAALKTHLVYFIGIHCALKTLAEREILRGNRALGLGRHQLKLVHGPTRFYDLELDTTKISAFDGAKQILTYIENHAAPGSFKRLRAEWNMGITEHK